MLYTNTLDDSQQPPTHCLLCLQASIMMNWACLSWAINLQLNVQIISPKNTNSVYVISALLDDSQWRVKGNILQGVSTIKLIRMHYWTSGPSRLRVIKEEFFFYKIPWPNSPVSLTLLFNQDTAEHELFSKHFLQHCTFRLHGFSVAGTREGPVDDK